MIIALTKVIIMQILGVVRILIATLLWRGKFSFRKVAVWPDSYEKWKVTADIPHRRKNSPWSRDARHIVARKGANRAIRARRDSWNIYFPAESGPHLDFIPRRIATYDLSAKSLSRVQVRDALHATRPEYQFLELQRSLRPVSSTSIERFTFLPDFNPSPKESDISRYLFRSATIYDSWNFHAVIADFDLYLGQFQELPWFTLYPLAKARRVCNDSWNHSAWNIPRMIKVGFDRFIRICRVFEFLVLVVRIIEIYRILGITRILLRPFICYAIRAIFRLFYSSNF